MARIPDSEMQELRKQIENMNNRNIDNRQKGRPEYTLWEVLTTFRKKHPYARLRLPEVRFGGPIERPRSGSRHIYKRIPKFVLDVKRSCMPNFKKADLRGARFYDEIWYCDFRGADLRGALFEGRINCCLFDGADLRGATFTSGVLFSSARGADLRDAIFIGGYLKRFDIEGASVDGAIMRHCIDAGLRVDTLGALAQRYDFFYRDKPYAQLTEEGRRSLWRSRYAHHISPADLQAAEDDVDEFLSMIYDPELWLEHYVEPDTDE